MLELRQLCRARGIEALGWRGSYKNAIRRRWLKVLHCIALEFLDWDLINLSCRSVLLSYFQFGPFFEIVKMKLSVLSALSIAFVATAVNASPAVLEERHHDNRCPARTVYQTKYM